MPASDAALNQSLDALAGVAPATNLMAFTSQHTAAPGTTGANEYAATTRQSCSWNAAATHAKTNSSALTFANSGASPVTDFGTFSAASAGTFGIGIHANSAVTAASITVAAGALSLTGTAT